MLVTYKLLEFVLMLGVLTEQVSAFHIFLIGALAKAVATVATYPLQVSQARIRVSVQILDTLYRDKFDILTILGRDVSIIKSTNPMAHVYRDVCLFTRDSEVGNPIGRLCDNLIESSCRNHGVAGLYKGLEVKLWQTVLTAALMFLCYEKIANFVFLIMGKQN